MLLCSIGLQTILDRTKTNEKAAKRCQGRPNQAGIQAFDFSEITNTTMRNTLHSCLAALDNTRNVLCENVSAFKC